MFSLMTRGHRWIAALASILIVVEAVQALAQEPPPQAKANAGAPGKAAGKRSARRRPKGKAPVGQIVPYPFPPTLIIRQTPEAHDEIRDLLNLLRYH